MNTEQLTKLLIEEIKDIYHAEKQLVRALPKMAKATESASLKEAINKHRAETRGKRRYLKKCSSCSRRHQKQRPCKGMQGLDNRRRR